MTEVKRFKREQKADKFAELTKRNDAKDDDEDGYEEWKASAERYVAFAFLILTLLSSYCHLVPSLTGKRSNLPTRLWTKSIHLWGRIDQFLM